MTVPGLSRAADLRADGNWSILVPLAPGANVITVTATDLAGNATESTVTIVRDVAVGPAPGDAAGYYALGLRALEEGDYQKAIAPLSAAIKLNPQHAAAYCARGVAYQQSGDGSAAVADLTSSISLAPAEPCGYDWRGYMYLRQGNFDLALADYQQAIALDPDSFVLYYRRGLVYRGLGENAKALADFQRAVQMTGGVWREAALRQIQDLAADAGH
ncbi:MAG: peptidase caspase catalytic subunit p20 [Firmicutes bacterium]|nr:peptidase caspase catalytic subunit p20 [Bacillota bacterium]